jgi:hypothetical protein
MVFSYDDLIAGKCAARIAYKRAASTEAFAVAARKISAANVAGSWDC